MNEAAATAELIKSGILGTIIVLSWGVIAFLYRALAMSQQARMDDAKIAQAQQLESAKSSVAALIGSTNAAVAVKESVGEIRSALSENNETLHEIVLQRQPSLRR